MGDWNSVHLELIFAVYIVGLGDSVFEHLFISLLAQNSPDIHSLGFASASRTGARDEEGEQNQSHLALDGRVQLSAPWRMRVDGRWLDWSALTVSSPAALECDRIKSTPQRNGLHSLSPLMKPVYIQEHVNTPLWRMMLTTVDSRLTYALCFSLGRRWTNQFCSNVVICVHLSHSRRDWIVVKVLSRVTWCSARDAVLGAENCARALMRAHSQITPDIMELSRSNRLQNICVNAWKITGHHSTVWLN